MLRAAVVFSSLYQVSHDGARLRIVMVYTTAGFFLLATQTSLAFRPHTLPVSASKLVISGLRPNLTERTVSLAMSSSTNTSNEPLHRAEGVFAVYKPLKWTSNDMTSYIRNILEQDARKRGLNPGKVGRRRGNKNKTIKVGHGGTLDPLATGVLVIGIGSGTRQMQK